ncbi:hypothetical protein F5Y16DRAFT_133479 [Xylariaceae sp. FL0255]|nr:hypothetical protein F5Y16DRAFT_133479 [Xylariaceae sp. FL0255]
MASSSAAGKTVIITGGAGGLGKALATAFLAAGANVAVCDVNDDRLKETSAEWTAAKHGDKFIATKADITSEESVTSFFGAATAKFGRLDILINNAGIMDKFDPAGETELNLWQRVIGVNLTGAFLCTKAAIKAFEAQEPCEGIIINIASIAALRGLNAGVAYTASKHGLLGLMRNTAGIYGPKGIYSIALLMGGMETNIADAMATGYNQEGLARSFVVNPGFEQGKTDVKLTDVAKYCIFLSDRSIAEASNGGTVQLSKNWPTN